MKNIDILMIPIKSVVTGIFLSNLQKQKRLPRSFSKKELYVFEFIQEALLLEANL
jgi:hypothetical protein